MWMHIKQLTAIQLCNVGGLNEARFGKDKRKKRRAFLMMMTYAFLALVLVGYMTMMAVGLVQIDAGQLIVSYLLTVTSLIILFFTFFRSPHVIFNLRLYEKEIVLPVSPTAIVISRFLTMYVFDLALSALTMLPGLIVYAVFLKPAASFYIMAVLGIFLLPLLPMSVALALGVLIFSIASRVRHKNLVYIVLSMLAVVASLVFSLRLNLYAEQMTEPNLAEITSGLSDKIHRIYPPARLFSDGVIGGDWLSYLLFAAASLAVFAIFVWFVRGRFASICAALGDKFTKKNYVMQKLPQSTPLMALYKKEIRRYFSSGLYVMNTGIGYVLMLLAAGAICFLGTERINQELGMPGLIEAFIPFLLASLCIISPTTTVAVSLEGRQWWIIKQLPVSAKMVFDSKLLVNLTIALPCYAASVLMLGIALRPDTLGLLWLVLLPLVYILFSAVLGLFLGTKMANFQWESEAEVVKQGASVLLTMLLGGVAVGAPAFMGLIFPSMANLIFAAGAVIVLAVTAALYRGLQNIRLIKIG